jgi:hypothetical protein
MAVADARGRRFDAATGIGFAVLAIVGLVLPGTPPTADDSVADITKFLADGRDEILTGNFLLGLAALLFLWWIGSLRSYLRAGEGGEGRLSAAAFGGAVAGIVLLLAGAGLLNAITFDLIDRGAASPTLVPAVFDGSGALFAMAAFPFATFFAAASCSAARSGALPPWAYWFGSVVAVIQVLGGIALFADSGVFASGGAVSGFVVPLSALIWVVAVSLVMMGRDGVPPEARTAP